MIPSVVKNFINSEKAVAVGLLVIGATVLTALGDMSIVQWTDYTKWMATLYVGGKTAHGVAAVIVNGKTTAKEVSPVATTEVPPVATSSEIAVLTGKDSERDQG